MGGTRALQHYRGDEGLWGLGFQSIKLHAEGTGAFRIVLRALRACWTYKISIIMAAKYQNIGQLGQPKPNPKQQFPSSFALSLYNPLNPKP